MARINVYLPDALADRARGARLNISSLTQDAVLRALAARDTDAWLDGLESLPRIDVRHDAVQRAVDQARDDLGFRATG
jgi:post-segregation antitoxin (ccd killing protein)